MENTRTGTKSSGASEILENTIAGRHRGGLLAGISGRLCAALIAGTVMLLPLHLPGEGFRNPPAGAFGLGRAGGRVAQIDDSSAAQHNPANLVDVPATELQLAPNIVYISVDYRSPTGEKSHTSSPWKLLPNGFASTPLFEGKAAVGLGLTVPYGLSNEWDKDTPAFSRPSGVLRYQAPYYTELKTIDISPAAALKLGDHLQVGASLDVMWSELTLKQFYPWFLTTQNLADPDGHIKAQGDGVGVGGKLALTLKITERQRLAVTYRLPMDIEYDGDFTADNVPAALGGGTFRTDFETGIKFPAIVAAGYGINLTDGIRVEADVEWLRFSRFKDLPLRVGKPLPGLPESVNQDWRDTFTIGIAGDWRINAHWVLRLGYQFYQTPVPDSTFSPTIPDADQNVITLGLGYRYKHHSLELAYGADFYDGRHITNDQNPAFNGTYDITVHLFALSYRLRF